MAAAVFVMHALGDVPSSVLIGIVQEHVIHAWRETMLWLVAMLVLAIVPWLAAALRVRRNGRKRRRGRGRGSEFGEFVHIEMVEEVDEVDVEVDEVDKVEVDEVDEVEVDEVEVDKVEVEPQR